MNDLWPSEPVLAEERSHSKNADNNKLLAHLLTAQQQQQQQQQRHKIGTDAALLFVKSCCLKLFMSIVSSK